MDDGNRSVYNAYYKVFKPLNIKPLLAIYPSITNRRKYALTWNQLKELADNGCYIAAHGFSHRFINDRLYSKEKKAFHNEIYLSKRILEKKLKRKIDTFVYPYGARADVVVNELKKAGYKYAFTIDNGKLKPLKFYGSKSVYNLPRYMITRGNRKYYFRKIVKSSSGRGSFIAAKKITVPDVYKKRFPEATGRKIKVNKNKTNRLAVIKKGPSDHYRKYKTESSPRDLIIKFIDNIAEPVSKNNKYYLYDNLTYISGRYAHDVKQVIDEGIVDAASDKSLIAYNSFKSQNISNDTIVDENNLGPGELFLSRYKKKYFKLTGHSYNIYSKMADIIKEKIRYIGKKIISIWDSIFA